MTSEKGSRRDKNQNIQVFVRLRPLNQRERDIKSLGVVEVLNGREVVVRQSQQTTHTKKFTFDRAFAPNTKQIEVYQQVVSPLIKEVLCGYNCTVFAYGQTGTGKTHTMVGESTGDENVNWQNDPLAGIIPRALSQLFDELRISNTEYTVRVSYLELYNEELFDLLSSSEDNSKLRIYEDVTRKGANIVNGLEEITVYNKNEVYKIMEQGQERKRVASTLMNAQSSENPNGKPTLSYRSHTVFTIVAHMKENNQEGEELVKIGKLNLVDLAGSENISKAGSDNPGKKERARECVNINQSLLTLGRVITALVERHPHIPYRESKLTRILQESLGGRTKTSIIATISPGHKDLEETMSTLEYANRAKNIQNKPEVNQKMTKTAMLKEYSEEIDKLKRDLQAARDKNGVCISSETFAEMNLKEEEQRKEIQELLLKKRAMEEERDRMETVFNELNQTLQERVSELTTTRQAMQTTKEQLANTKNVLQTTKMECEEQKHLVSKHVATEEELSAQAKDIIAVADTAAAHVDCLHQSVDRRRMVESTNIALTQTFQQQSSALRAELADGVQQFVEALTLGLQALDQESESYTTITTNSMEESKAKLEELAQKILENTKETSSLASTQHEQALSSLSLARDELARGPAELCAGFRAALLAALQRAAAATARVRDWGAPAAVDKLAQGWLTDSTERVACLRRAQAGHVAATVAAEARRAQLHRRQRDARRQRLLHASGRVHDALTQLETERTELEQRLDKQAADIEEERSASEQRLAQWAEAERRRLERHVQDERAALQTRLDRRLAALAEERQALQERLRWIQSWRAEQMAAVEEENKMADADLAECEAGGQECLDCADKYGKQFVEDTVAMSADMRAFSGSVVQVTEHYNTELLELLTEATAQIEQEANAAIASGEESVRQLCVRAGDSLDEVAASNKQLLEVVVQKIEGAATAHARALGAAAAEAGAAAERARGGRRALGCGLGGLRRGGAELRDAVRAALQRLQLLEARTFAEDFRVYQPSGNTPLRQQYHLPRTLAATSPHERILARFRAVRRAPQEEDCIVVESDPESRAPSDSESSVSEDSALSEFTTPSPPEPRAPPVKCTSETDIYYRKPGKENTAIPPYKPVSHKKTSRLPAPTSLKKPLVERND